MVSAGSAGGGAAWSAATQSAGTLVTDNATMLPDDSVLIIMTDAVEHLLVGDELFHFIIVALNEVLDPFRVVGKHAVLVLGTLGNAGSKAGSIFLLIHEEGPAN
jgi:hypothetical protein